MIRVLHSVSNMNRAGIETMLMNYYRHIDRTKIQFDFLCNKEKSGAYDEEIKRLGGNIYHSPGLNPLKWFKYQKMMKQLFHEHSEIKIVCSHNGAFSLQAQLAAKKNNIKHRITHVHGTKIDINLKLPLKLLYKPFLKTTSNYYWGCGKDAINYYFGNNIIKANNYRIIKNAIEIEDYIYNKEKRDFIRKKYNLEDKFVIGNVARFMKQKNHTFMLDLFKVILSKKPNSILMLLGDGELQKKMKDKAKELGIEKSVIFAGNVDNVNEMYQAMDVFILPSLFEGLPVVGIEAQTAGLKCFMSDTITKEVAITDNIQFLSLKGESVEKWANTILSYENYERKDMSKEIIEAGYSITKEAKKLEEIYLKMGETDEENRNINTPLYT